MSKLVGSIREAIKLCGLKDGMTISLHHHLRDGDLVTNMICETIEEMGIKDITLHSSGVLQGCTPIIKQIKAGTITKIDTTGIGANIGLELGKGIMKNPAVMRTHGGFPGAVQKGDVKLDVAFIAASAADCMGNLNGVMGPNAFGSAGYTYLGARYADKVVVITDFLADYPLYPYSVDETYVDYVVKVDSIGDSKGITSGITRITKDPVGLRIAKYATEVIKFSGLLKDGMSFQTGAGGSSLAVTKFLKEAMKEKQVTGSFILGGICRFSVELLEEGYFQTIVDTQDFDARAIESIRTNPKHVEISASRYANPFAGSCVLDSLDVGILGGIEIDTEFNVNVHTTSGGYLMGGSGGHGDIADSAKLAIIVAPLLRARLPVIVDQVICKSTPGDVVDVVVTQYGIAVNPRRQELKYQLVDAGLPVSDINDLYKMATDLAGVPKKPKFGDKVVAEVYHRTNYKLDEIRNVLD
ncbi:MAG: citrate lyase subunit alpha [Peptococcaceae bacterium]